MFERRPWSKKDQLFDPFQALKYAEMVVDGIAQSLALCRVRRPGELCWFIAFGGIRAA